MKRGVALVAVVLAFAPGCASGSPGDLTAAAERVLVPEVQRIRDIAATGTYSQLQSAVKHLKSVVASEQRRGQVTAARAGAIDDAADELLVDAAPTPSASPTPSESSTSATPTPTPSATPTPTPSATPTTSSSTNSPSPGVTISVP